MGYGALILAFDLGQTRRLAFAIRSKADIRLECLQSPANDPKRSLVFFADDRFYSTFEKEL
jgi:hypothetical protein